MDKKVVIELTAEIVSAHASVNEMSREDLLDEIQSVFAKLSSLVGSETVETAAAAEVKPTISLKKAFGSDKVYCLECGKGFTTLKKHLAVSHNQSPKDYRKKFNIPSKTPLVARNYSEAKKKMAQKLGLAEKLAAGRKKRAK
jgi:predicted transcriptional regulator